MPSGQSWKHSVALSGNVKLAAAWAKSRTFYSSVSFICKGGWSQQLEGESKMPCHCKSSLIQLLRSPAGERLSHKFTLLWAAAWARKQVLPHSSLNTLIFIIPYKIRVNEGREKMYRFIYNNQYCIVLHWKLPRRSHNPNSGITLCTF